MNKEVKRISAIDWVLAVAGVIVLVGAYFVLRYGLGLDPERIELTDEIKVMMYILVVSFTFTYITLIENVNRWTKLGIIKTGEKSYNKKMMDGFPINESFIGYKFINAKEIIRNTTEEVMVNNDMDTFEDVVWFVNMENRQKKYNKLIRKLRKKISKKQRKARSKRNEELMVKYEAELETNREHLQWTNDMLEAINSYDIDKTTMWDNNLYEIYDIKVNELDAQSLLDDEQFINEHWLDRLRASKAWYVMTTWIFPVIIGISFIVLGFMYNWKFDEILSDSEKIILNLLIIYLSTKIPTTILKAFTTTFPIVYLKGALGSAYVFQKYKQFKVNHKEKDEA